jgi:hypothetical protein
MRIDLDGAAVLRAIVDHPTVFPDVAAELSRAAQSLVAIQLKARTTTLESVRSIYRTIGHPDFAIVLDGLTDARLKSLTKKLDKENPDLNSAPPDWHARRLCALASGAEEPNHRPAAAARRRRRPALTSEEQIAAKELKGKAVDSDKAQSIFAELGEAGFGRVVATLTERQAIALAKRLDNDNPAIASATSDWLFERISALAGGRAEPVTRSFLESKAMTAKRIK